MKTIVLWGVKKYALGFLNTTLEGAKDSVQKALSIVDICILKAEAVLAFFKSVRAKLADNKLDDDEAEAILLEGEMLIGQVLKK